MFTSQQTPSDGSSPFAVSYLAPNYLTLFILWIVICEATAMFGRFLIVRVKNWAHVRQLGEHLLAATNGMTEEAKAFAASLSDEKIASGLVVANLPAAVSHGIVGVLCLPVCVHGWSADASGSSTSRWGGGSGSTPISVFRTPEYLQNGEWEKLFVLGMMFDTALNLYDVVKSFVCFEKFGFWKKVDALREMKSQRVWGFLIPCHFALPVSIVPVIVTILHHSLAIVLVPFVSKNGHILQLAELHLLYMTMTLLGPILHGAEVVKQVQDLHTQRGFFIFRICVTTQFFAHVPRLVAVTYCGVSLWKKFYALSFGFVILIGTTVLLSFLILLTFMFTAASCHAVLHMHEKNKTAEGRASLKTAEGRASLVVHDHTAPMGREVAKRLSRMSINISLKACRSTGHPAQPQGVVPRLSGSDMDIKKME